MFMGEYNHTLDTKGRLIIPTKFRETLGEKFVVTKGLDGCLFVYDNAGWTAFEEKLQAMPISRKDTRMFVRHFLAGAAEVEVDKQGRALIPSKLREFAELTKDVVLVGAAGHIEIWSQERWDALEEEAGGIYGGYRRAHGRPRTVIAVTKKGKIDGICTYIRPVGGDN